MNFQFEYPPFEENSKSMFYSMYRCNELKKNYEKINNFKYDIVVKLRYDIIIYKKINYIIDNNLHIIDRPGGEGLGWNDSIIYGNSDLMDIYCSLFEEYKYSEIIKQKCPEYLTQQHIKSNNISIQYIYDIDFYVVRNCGQKMKL
jgi:hypothetical protein